MGMGDLLIGKSFGRRVSWARLAWEDGDLCDIGMGLDRLEGGVMYIGGEVSFVYGMGRRQRGCANKSAVGRWTRGDMYILQCGGWVV